MPLFKHKETGQYQLAIWYVQEPASFFEKETGLRAPHKIERHRLEFLASRYLLKLLTPSFPFDRVEQSPSGKPFLPSEGIHFSISHSFPFVGIVLSPAPVGIDVQVFRQKIARLQSKFLSATEQAYFNDDVKQLTLAWAAKEAVFKWAGLPAIDFKAHMPIRDYRLSYPDAFMEIGFQKKMPEQPVQLLGEIEDDFGWMVTLPVL